MDLSEKFFCLNKQRTVSKDECIRDFVDATALSIPDHTCVRCPIGKNNRFVYSESEGCLSEVSKVIRQRVHEVRQKKAKKPIKTRAEEKKKNKNVSKVTIDHRFTQQAYRSNLEQI